MAFGFGHGFGFVQRSGAPAIPANAIRLRDGSFITDRAGDYIVTRS